MSGLDEGAIVPMSREDMLAHIRRRGSPQSALRRAVEALRPGAGVKTTCGWKHNAKGVCGGHHAVTIMKQQSGFRLHATCHQGTFYVWREEQ